MRTQINENCHVVSAAAVNNQRMNNKNSIRSNNNYGASATNIPTSTSPVPSTSPSISLPPLKKRTAVVKTSVPPPVPPRGGSPRVRGDNYNKSKSTALINKLTRLSNSQMSGQEKVEDWLAQKTFIADGRLHPLPVIRSKGKKLPVPLPSKIQHHSINKTSQDDFKSVKALIESFSKSTSDDNYKQWNGTKKVSDLQMVKSRVNKFSLVTSKNDQISQSTEIQAISQRKADITNQMGGGCSVLHARTNSAFTTLMNQFSLEGEFV